MDPERERLSSAPQGRWGSFSLVALERAKAYISPAIKWGMNLKMVAAIKRKNQPTNSVESIDDSRFQDWVLGCVALNLHRVTRIIGLQPLRLRG